MVALRRRPKNEASPLEKAERQITDLRAELLADRARLAEVHFELESLATSPDARAAQLATLRNTLNKAEQDREELEEYCALLTGHDDAERLEQSRLHIVELKRQFEATETAHLQAEKERKARERELRAELAALEQAIGTLDTRLRATLAVRERLLSEQARATLAECDRLLTDAEHMEAEHRERYETARRVAVQARADARDRLAEWPSLRRELEGSHKLTEDATSEALAAFVEFLRLLIEKGPAIEYCAAGYPAGVVSILGEMELDGAMTRALASGDVFTTRAMLERVEHLLKQYRRSLAMV